MDGFYGDPEIDFEIGRIHTSYDKSNRSTHAGMEPRPANINSYSYLIILFITDLA
jgi:hypothetical protein